MDHAATLIKCEDCTFRAGGCLCNLSEPGASRLRSLANFHIYPRGKTLFVEGQTPDGVYLLCTGKVKLSAYSEAGKAIILRIVKPGEALGLSASISGMPHEATAQTLDQCQVSFLHHADFMVLLKENHDAALNVMKQLSNNYLDAHSKICSLGLSTSVGDKLAKLLIDWCDGASHNNGAVHIIIEHTHSEMAEMIGTSRETVTRLLREFRIRGLIEISKAELVIPDRKRLRAAIGGRFHSTG